MHVCSVASETLSIGSLNRVFVQQLGVFIQLPLQIIARPSKIWQLGREPVSFAKALLANKYHFAQFLCCVGNIPFCTSD